MALFPKCSFKVLVPDGLIIPGSRIEGELVIDAPEDIPRAEHVTLDFRSTAWAGYGSGNNRSVVRREMFHSPLHIDLPKDQPLTAGEHRFPFTLVIPSWLPPAYRGVDCAIEHVIETRLDVDWAVDPVAKMTPAIMLDAKDGTRSRLTMRSPPAFHDEVVLEVTLASSVISVDEPLVGQIALRSGHSARFDAVDLAFAGSARIAMGRNEARRQKLSTIRIPAARLRTGEAVPFTFPPADHVLPTFRSSFIDHDVVLVVSLDIPWASDPSFELRLEVLPAGSVIRGDATTAIVGSERLRRLASSMASATGLKEDHPPGLVHGNIGPVSLAIVDAPRNAKLGIDVDITYPDIELGVVFRPLGMLEGFRSSPLLPRGVGERYLLRCSPTDGRPPVDESVLASFLETILSSAEGAEDVRFSDHHLGVHIPLANDDEGRMLELARAAQAEAKSIGEAIAALPFPNGLGESRAAWQATATEQNAFLVPTGPALHGVSFRARVVGGEERSITTVIRTVWKKNAAPTIAVEVDLHEAPVPEAAWGQLEGETTNEALRTVRATFPITHVSAKGKAATLEQAAWTPDPRALLSVVETFLWWVLEARGERRADLPYR